MADLYTVPGPVPWALTTERARGKGDVSAEDVINRSVRFMLAASGYDPDEPDFLGLPGKVVNVASRSGTDVATRVMAAAAKLGTQGGILDCRSLSGTMAFGEDLVIDQPSVTILLPSAVLSMGSSRVRVSSASHGFQMEGPTCYGGNQVLAADTGGAFFLYTGAGNPFEIGDPTGAALLRWLRLKDFTIHCTGAADSANVVGLWLRRVLFGLVETVYIPCSVTSDNQVCLRLDGTGNFLAHCHLKNLSLNGGGVGVHCTGSGVAAAIANRFDAGNYAGNNNVASKGFQLDAQSSGNFIDGWDLEGCAVGLDIGGTVTGTKFFGRVESNTLDAAFGASTVHNLAWFAHGSVSPTFTDAGSQNSVWGPNRWRIGPPLSVVGVDVRHGLLGSLLGADFNVTTDQAIANLPASYVIERILVTNASLSLNTAAGGIYTAAAKGGTAVVAAAQAYAALTAATKQLALGLADTDRRTATTLYLSLTTPQGAAATADVYVFGYRL